MLTAYVGAITGAVGVSVLLNNLMAVSASKYPKLNDGDLIFSLESSTHFSKMGAFCSGVFS